ncbi:MAG: peptidoglycan-binding protein [Clostridiales bacterium]|nr:peptidoglycan-binding protein [Clostridiales bacterium]
MANEKKYRLNKRSGLGKILAMFGRMGRSIGSGVATLARRIAVWAENLWINFLWLWRKANLVGKAVISVLGSIVLVVLIVIIVAIANGRGVDPTYNVVAADTPAPFTIDPATLEDPDYFPEPVDHSTPAPAPSGIDFVLKKGDSNPVVPAVQQRLMELGYMDFDEPTDKFGSITSHAVLVFQKHNDLSADGHLGSQTYDRLFSDNAKIYVMQKGDTGDDVLAAKERLYQLGYINSKPKKDVFDDDMHNAVLEFQKKNKLNADGKVGNKTLDKLYDEDPVSKVLQKGSEGDDVKTFETKLYELGFLKEKPDTRYGNATTSAVKAFQRANDMQADGCIGPQTRDLLLSGNAAGWVLAVGDSGSDVKAVQTRLKKLGYITSSSAVTGYYGEVTENAVREFQKRNDLTQDGKVGRKTFEKMNSSNAKPANVPRTPTPRPNAKTPTPRPGTTARPGTTTPKPTATPKPSNASGVKLLIEKAESRLGMPYVRGAKGPDAFDCSGLVYWCLRQAGVSVSYMTSRAWASTTRFTRIKNMSDVKAGDILVFDGHVGIAISSSTMIDASSANASVVKRSFTTSWCKNSWICAYRVF